jgi:hypothetical protein
MLLTGCIYAVPTQFSLALTYDQRTGSSIGRRLELSINNTTVGYVSYNISLNNSYPSNISVLQVYPDHRGSHGYGKILLYSAINDIRSAGNPHIILTRSPFNLKAGESWQTRDQQLRAWYEKFGFVAMQGGSNMELAPHACAAEQDVVSMFGNDGVAFGFKKSQDATMQPHMAPSLAEPSRSEPRSGSRSSHQRHRTER